MRIRAHYDGKVFVPDEPVRLVPNASLNIWVDEIRGNLNETDQAIREYYLAQDFAPDDQAWGDVTSSKAWDGD